MSGDAGRPPARRREPDPDDARLDEAFVGLALLVAIGAPGAAIAGVAGVVGTGGLPPGLTAGVTLALVAVALLAVGLFERRPWARAGLLVVLATLGTVTLGAAVLAWPLGCVGAILVAPFAWAALGLARGWQAYTRGRRAPILGARADCSASAFWAGYLAFFALIVALAWTQVAVRTEMGLLSRSDLSLVAMGLGSVVGAGAVLAGASSLLRARAAARRAPSLVSPAARARVLALRAQGRSLRELADALAAEGHASPEGPRFSGLLLRAVLDAEPRARRS